MKETNLTIILENLKKKFKNSRPILKDGNTVLLLHRDFMKNGTEEIGRKFIVATLRIEGNILILEERKNSFDDLKPKFQESCRRMIYLKLKETLNDEFFRRNLDFAIYYEMGPVENDFNLDNIHTIKVHEILGAIRKTAFKNSVIKSGASYGSTVLHTKENERDLYDKELISHSSIILNVKEKELRKQYEEKGVASLTFDKKDLVINLIPDIFKRGNLSTNDRKDIKRDLEYMVGAIRVRCPGMIEGIRIIS